MTLPASGPRLQTPLQQRLARAILETLRRDRLMGRNAINQMLLAARLGVSRTPVRAALEALCETGAVIRSERGFAIGDLTAGDVGLETRAEDALIGRIARDRHGGELPAEVSEAELMRRYDCQRSEVVAALRRLADLGIALRKPGFGWRFIGAADTTDARAASYRFRLALEPAALMEPGYAADPAWLAEMRAAHERVLRRRWQAADAVPFFEMNAAFHLGLVTFSGNRFFIQATEQQNGLRRLRNYSWRLGPERAAISCRDHLDIIAALEAGDAALAAGRLAAHLQSTANLVRAMPEGEEAP